MFPGIEEGTWTPTKVRELREEENLESFLGGKIERKRQRGVVKKDVVVGNGAPPTAVKSASPKQEDEKPKEEGSATPAGKGKSPEAGGTGMDAPAGASSVDTPGQKNSASGQDPDLDLPDVDDNDEDDEEGEEGEELEEGEEPEGELEGDIGETQEGDGDQVEEIVVSDDEDMAEGEEIVEDIIEFGEESGEKGGVMYVEDEDDEEGAVFPIQKGKVTDWGCFFALLYAFPPFHHFLLTDFFCVKV